MKAPGPLHCHWPGPKHQRVRTPCNARFCLPLPSRPAGPAFTPRVPPAHGFNLLLPCFAVLCSTCAWQVGTRVPAPGPPVKLNEHCVAFTQVAAWRAPQACGWHSGWCPSRPLRSLPVVALSSLSRTRYNPAGALALTLQPGIAGKSGCQRERRPSLRHFKAARAGSQTAPSKGSDPQYIDLKIGRSGIPPTCPHVTKVGPLKRRC